MVTRPQMTRVVMGVAFFVIVDQFMVILSVL